MVRALALYRTRLAQRDGGSLSVPRFRAHLTKVLPVDAGLGGAASNAAAALLGANALCGGLASAEELKAWAVEGLGCDVASYRVSYLALSTGYSPLPTAYCLRPTAYGLLTSHYSLLTAHCTQLATHYIPTLLPQASFLMPGGLALSTGVSVFLRGDVRSKWASM